MFYTDVDNIGDCEKDVLGTTTGGGPAVTVIDVSEGFHMSKVASRR